MTSRVGGFSSGLVVFSAGLVSLLCVGSLPIWSVWYANAWEAHGEAGVLWRALYHVPANVHHMGWLRVISDLQLHNLLLAGVVFGLGVLVGRRLVLGVEKRRLLTGRCRACGYDLRASQNRCPECGSRDLHR